MRRIRILFAALGLIGLSACVTTEPDVPVAALTVAQRAFYVDALANQAWFVLREHPEQVAIVRAQPGAAPTLPDWNDFNAILRRLPADLRPGLQQEALALVLARLP